MIATYTIEKNLLFDGPEAEAWARSFELHAPGYTGGAVPLADFIKNDFEDLQTLIGNTAYESILKTGHFAVDNGFLHLHKGSEGLRLFFCKKQQSILVFAFGETQPTRYKLYLEGVWVMEG